MTEGINVTVLQERDLVARAPVYAGAGALGTLLLVGLAVTWLIARGLAPSSAILPVPVPREINQIDQTLFNAHESSTGRAEGARPDLNRYGWIDRSRGVIQIPIDRAMEIVAGAGDVR